MKKPKPRKPQDEDEAQSRRFMEEAARAEVDGGLSLTEVEAEFNASMSKVVRSTENQPEE